MLRCSVARSRVRDAHAGELPEAGVDAVDGLALGDECAPRLPRSRPRSRRQEGSSDGAAPSIDRAPGRRAERRPASARSLSSASPDAGVKRIEAHAVDELGRALDVPDREVGGLAGLQRAGHRSCRPSARAASRVTPARHSSTVMRNKRRRHVHRQQQRGQRRRAGIAVGRDRHRHAVPAEQLDRRLLRLADEVEGAGQDAPRPCLPRPWRRRRPRRCIRGDRPTSAPKRGGERRAAEVGKLVGVELDRQAERTRRREHALDLRRREGDALAEAVDGVGKPLGGDARASSRQRRGRCSASLSPPISGGSACAPRKVVATLTGRSAPSRRAARSDLRSLARSSP